MPSHNTNPVSLEGRLEPDLSRGLWIVKWLLVVPHAVILLFLWIAVAALSVVAWFAILLTARYPRFIFDFNLGVLRWSWRVWFYSYGALGTDRYPPFTLGPAPDYPAQLDIACPERLSRRLVLVKSWLLAIPHYLVLGFFLGAGAAADRADGRPAWPWSVGLVGLLVLVAAVALLFTGRYPRSIFGFVMGMNRWAFRVAAYVLLMTDAYPPFRLDQGGGEPAVPSADPPGAGDASHAALPATNGGWTTLRILGLVVGCLLLTGALATGAGGGALLFADKQLRDHDGFVMTGGERFTTSTYAITTENLRLEGSGLHAFVGDVKVTAHGSHRPVFIGIARTDQVDSFLAGVAHAVVTGVSDGTPRYRELAGTAPGEAPGDALAWQADATGDGSQSLRWDATSGSWSVVLMNADGSAGVSAVVSAGATLPVLGWGAVTLLLAAGTLAILGLVLVVVSLPRPPRSSRSSSGGTPAPPHLTDAVR